MEEHEQDFVIVKPTINSSGYSPKIGTKIYPEYENFVLKDPNRILSTQYSDEILQHSFNKIKEAPGNYFASSSNNKITYHFYSNFYRKERELWKDTNIQERLYKNRKKYIGKTQETITNEELLRGFKISGIYTGYSHFCPLWAKAFFKEFNCKRVLDPCGGWGQRLLGATDLELYVYNDIWKESYDNTNNLIKYFNITNVMTFNCDSVDIPVEQIGGYDTIFTCPPYFNTEVYDPTKKFTNYEDFLNWVKKTFKRCIIDSVQTIGIVINLSNLEIFERIIQEFGFELIRIQPVGRNKKSHLNKFKKERENILIFKRKIHG